MGMDAPNKTVVLCPWAGQTLKHYRIEGLIGQGGMGVVYRAQDLKLQRPVAIKVLPAELTADAVRRKRFLLEARTAARLSHPAIAQVYDVDEQDGTIFIAMELVEGQTISQLIQHRQLDLLGTVDVGIQVCAGLAKAHETGIVHRDIKPANVIQTPDGHVKILDFGLAKLLDTDWFTGPGVGGIHEVTTLTQTQIGVIKGTPAYMSPEQIKGDPIDARSDLFSLGIMLFEMATGEVPFVRETPTEVMHAIAFAKTPAMHSAQSNLPGDFQRIVARCLEKSPADRYPNARAVLEDLRVLRRKMESGQAPRLSFKERVRGVLGQLAELKPSEYAWLLGGGLVLIFLFYLIIAQPGMTPIPLLVAGLLIYRRIRDQPRRLVEMFVRKMSRLPEVRFIVCQDRRITVGVDRATGQLYGRINHQLSACNRRLFFGEPMSVVIRSDLTAEETRQWLAAPGVRYLREDSRQVN